MTIEHRPNQSSRDFLAVAAALALVGLQGCDPQSNAPREGVDDGANPGHPTPGDDRSGDDDDDRDDQDRDTDEDHDESGGDDEGCGDTDGGEELVTLDPSVCSPVSGGEFTAEIDNAYSPMPAGQTLVLEGADGRTRVRVEIRVLDEIMTVMGVHTRVVTETEFEDGEMIELSRNFYAQTADGTVCYFGEEVQQYEDGMLVGGGGSWSAGVNNARPGIFMPGNPRPGTMFATEIAPGVAEDMRAILEVGVPVSVPAGDFADTVHAIDWSVLEGETLEDGEDKSFARGFGLVIDDVVELIDCDGDDHH